MKRNLLTTIEFSQTQVKLSVFEIIATKMIRLLQEQAVLQNAQALIKNVLLQVASLVGAPLQDVFVIVDPSFDPLSQIEVVSTQVALKDGYVSKVAINDIFSNATKDQSTGRQLILEHPLKFVVRSTGAKTFYAPPLLAQGKSLEAKIVVASISKLAFNNINRLLKAHKLVITQIFLRSQTLAHAFVSTIAMKAGAILVHFDVHNVTVAVAKNGTIAAFFQIASGKMQHLYEQVQKVFKCSYADAEDIILTYGSLKAPLAAEVIYTKQVGLSETRYTNNELYMILKTHFEKTLSLVSSLVSRKLLMRLPIVIAGEITKLADVRAFVQTILQTDVMLHSPLQYLEVGGHNASAIGAIKGATMLKSIYDKKQFDARQYQSRIGTFFQKKSKQTLFSRWMSKLGEKYD